jgi:hypothetical protein
MAIDILSIPTMSVELKRLFFSAKLTVTDIRNKLGVDSIKATECLKS